MPLLNALGQRTFVISEKPEAANLAKLCGDFLGAKDIRLLLGAAQDPRLPMPLASLLHDRFLRLLAGGGEQLDRSPIGGLAASDAGQRVVAMRGDRI